MAATDFLTEEIGPLPVWAWGAVGATGVAAGLYLRRFLDRGDTGPTVSPNPLDGAFVEPFGGVGGGSFGSVGGGVSNVTPVSEETNAQWRAKAFQTAITGGGFTAIAAEQAIGGYLNGRQLTASESAVIEYVLGQIGLPPFPPTVVPGEAPPGEVPPPPPSGGGGGGGDGSGTYTVRPGDSLWEIAKARWGSSYGPYWTVIYLANRSTLGPDPERLNAGVTLNIPAKPSGGPPSIPGWGGPGSGPIGGSSGGGSSSQARTPTAPAPVPRPTPAPPPVRAPTPAPPSVPRPGSTYTVVRGDNLWDIAKKHYGSDSGGLWPAIYNVNRNTIGPNPDVIHPGQRLTIPPKPSSAPSVNRVSTTSAPSRSTSSPSSSSATSGRTTIATSSTGGTTYYTVASGDTLSAIGSRFGVPWQTIYANNRGLIGSNPNLIRPGQRLRIR